ncbi:hypothetical protein PFDG_05221, partial [Plasmodium falciparum Dd2]
KYDNIGNTLDHTNVEANCVDNNMCESNSLNNSCHNSSSYNSSYNSHSNSTHSSKIRNYTNMDKENPNINSDNINFNPKDNQKQNSSITNTTYNNINIMVSSSPYIYNYTNKYILKENYDKKFNTNTFHKVMLSTQKEPVHNNNKIDTLFLSDESGKRSHSYSACRNESPHVMKNSYMETLYTISNSSNSSINP